MNSALFRAHSTGEADRREAIVEVVKPVEPARTVANRFLEASFLRHSNLVRIPAAGILEAQGLVYAVSEPIDHTLTQFVAQRPLPEDDAVELTEQLIDALSYLHSENLVFCNLRPESVWRVGSEWKLGDFSQLRVIGRSDSRDLRTALARRPDLPPEVYEGMVSPAWDVWSLGLLLRRVLMPEPAHVEGAVSIPRGRQLRNADLPAPFDTITRDCLDPSMESRITLDELRSRLRPQTKTPSPPSLAGSIARTFGSDQSGSARIGPAYSGAAQLASAHARVLKDRVVTFFERLPKQRPAMQAGLALAGAALILGILAAANALVRHGEPAPSAARTTAPITVSEADRSVQPGPASSATSSNGADQSGTTNFSDDIKSLLDKWVSSTRSHDIRANLDCYAPSVESFYGRQALSHDQLVREKQRQFQNIGRVRKYGLENVTVNRISRDKAIVSFDKEWSFGERNAFEGAERAELTVRNIDGAWKIASEREVKVYWVRRGRQP